MRFPFRGQVDLCPLLFLCRWFKQDCGDKEEESASVSTLCICKKGLNFNKKTEREKGETVIRIYGNRLKKVTMSQAGKVTLLCLIGC
jgi:hypothetical protein